MTSREVNDSNQTYHQYSSGQKQDSTFKTQEIVLSLLGSLGLAVLGGLSVAGAFKAGPFQGIGYGDIAVSMGTIYVGGFVGLFATASACAWTTLLIEKIKDSLNRAFQDT